MNTRSLLFYASLIPILTCSFPVEALRARPKPFKCAEESALYFNEHYNKGCYYYQKQKWKDASKEFERVTFFGGASEELANAHFYLAVCFFEMHEYDFANEEFSNYLKSTQTPVYFTEAIQYKFAIAERFKEGARRRYFTLRYCPKWASAQEVAISIYDEIIVAVPNHELTVQALFSKGLLLMTMEEYRESVDAFQTLIRRFPKHELVPQAYLNVGKDYFYLSRIEFQNPDILGLAEINARKFRDEFPREERVVLVDNTVQGIKESYAKGLSDIGRLYERMGEPKAAIIYYRSAIEEFPETEIASFARSRLICLGCEDESESE